MDVDTFDKVVGERLDKIRSLLIIKGREYTRGNDRLSNFKNGAALQRCTPARACLGYMTKRFVSVIDLVGDMERGETPTRAQWEEKLGDCINYLILLEAIVREGQPDGPADPA